MTVNLDFLTVQMVLTFLLAFFRVLALFMTAPIFSRAAIPVVTRLGIAAVVVIMFYGNILDSSIGLIPRDNVHLILAIFHEILIGAILGLLINLIFDAIVTYAQMAGIQIGQSSSSLFNPALQASLNPIAEFYLNTSLLFFLMLDGLFDILVLLDKSFQLVPLAGFTINMSHLAANFTDLLAQVFIVASKFMLPLVLILFMIDIFVALFAKILPQANMYFLIMPTKLILGMIIISFVLKIHYMNLEGYFETNIFDLFQKLFS